MTRTLLRGLLAAVMARLLTELSKVGEVDVFEYSCLYMLAFLNLRELFKEQTE